MDGQHRAAALIWMASNNQWDPYSRNIVVDVFEVESEQDIAKLFHEINSAEPVRLVDMPSEVCMCMEYMMSTFIYLSIYLYYNLIYYTL